MKDAVGLIKKWDTKKQATLARIAVLKADAKRVEAKLVDAEGLLARCEVELANAKAPVAAKDAEKK